MLPCACLLPASCSLPFLCGCCSTPREEESGLWELGSQIPLLRMLEVRAMDNNSPGRYGKSLALSHRFRPGHLAWIRGHGSPGCYSGAGHCDLPPFPAVSVVIISLAASGAWLLIALTHYLKAPANTWGIITHI